MSQYVSGPPLFFFYFSIGIAVDNKIGLKVVCCFMICIFLNLFTSGEYI